MLILTVLLLVLGIIFLYKSLFVVQQAQAIVIERFGKFHRTIGPGIHFVLPFIEIPRTVVWTHFAQGTDKRIYRLSKTITRVDLRESVDDFMKQNVITRDNVNIEINALIYYQIIDPKAAIYEILNLPEAIEKLTQTTLRNVIGSMDLDETLVSRDSVNHKLRIILDEATDKWGVKVNRVELQEVNPPADIRHAMEKQMRAERDRRAIILESEGQKQAAILTAQGEQESSILRAKGIADSQAIKAEGEAIARFKIAEAEGKAIELIKSACPGQDPMAYLATIQYIKALPQMMEGKDNKVILVPYEASGFSGSILAIKKLLDQVK